jgi:hypothetical protein
LCMPVQLTGNSVSSMVGLFQPNKYVGLREIVGTWKIKQKVRRSCYLAEPPLPVCPEHGVHTRRLPTRLGSW